MKKNLIIFILLLLSVVMPMVCAAQGSATNPDYTAVEAATVSIRNIYPVGLRKWGMLITVFADPTSSNNKTYYLKYNQASISKGDNNNWVDASTIFGSGGGGITNSAAVNEMMKSDGTNAVSSGIFSTTLGNVNLGTSSVSGDRTISAQSSSTNNNLIFQTTDNSGAAVNTLKFWNSTIGPNTTANIETPMSYMRMISNIQFYNRSLAGAGSIFGFNFSNFPAGTNLVVGTNTNPPSSSISPLRIINTATGSSPSAGFGVGVDFGLQNASLTNYISSSVSSVATTTTAGSESSDFIFKNINGGTLAERFRILSTGATLIPNATSNPGSNPTNGFYLYADGSNSSHPTVRLPSGATVDLTAGGGGSSQWTTTGSDIYYNTGGVMIGAAAAPSAAKLQTIETSTSATRGVSFRQYSNDGSSSRLFIDKSRGTFASPTVITSGDFLGNFTFRGYDGTNFINAGELLVTSTGTISPGIVQSTLKLRTANASGTMSDALTVDGSQNVSLANPMAPSSGGTGQNTSSSTGVAQVNGGTWSVSNTLPSGALSNLDARYASIAGQSLGTFSGAFNLTYAIGGQYSDYTQTGSLTLSVGSSALMGNATVKITSNGSAITVPGTWVNIGTDAISTINGDVNRMVVINTASEVWYFNKVN